jgi:hypothetical protein
MHTEQSRHVAALLFDVTLNHLQPELEAALVCAAPPHKNAGQRGSLPIFPGGVATLHYPHTASWTKHTSGFL